MVKEEFGVISWIFYLITIVLSILVIGMLVWKLTGHSPEETIVLWLMGILVTFQVLVLVILFQIKSEIGGIKGRIEGLNKFKRQTIERIKEIDRKIK